jgi:hypothetical protein
MEASAHRDLIITVRYRPGADPATKLVMRLDHDHRYAAFGQPDRRRHTSNATPSDHDGFGLVC